MTKFADDVLETQFLHQELRNMPGWLPATLLIFSGSLILGRSFVHGVHSSHMPAQMCAALLFIAAVLAAVLFMYRTRQRMLWEMVFQKADEMSKFFVGFLVLTLAVAMTAETWDSTHYHGVSFVSMTTTNLAMGLILPLRRSEFVAQSVMVLSIHIGALVILATDGLVNTSDLLEIIPLICTAIILCIFQSKQDCLARAAFLRQHASAQDFVVADHIGNGTLNRYGASGPSDGTLPSQSSLPDTSELGEAIRKVGNCDAGTKREQLKNIAKIGQYEHWLVDDKALTLETNQILGAGTFGVVVKGSLYNTPVAIKVPRDSGLASKKNNLQELGNELRVLRLLHHPNIVMFRGACLEPNRGGLALVLEMVQGERLDHYLTNAHIPPSHLSRFSILVGVTRALCYLHAQRPQIVHADVKGSNILVENVSGFPFPKLLDFGLSRLVTKRAMPLGGSLAFMAPEVARGRKGPNCAADVFSFGRLAFFHHYQH